MRCPECAGEVSALREFCPHCGAPLHRASRDDGLDPPAMRSDEELKRNRKRVLVIGVAILFAATLAGKISWVAGTIDLGLHRHERGPLAIEAEQVYDAYRDDSHAAARRFRGREMVVSGEFLRIVPDGNGDPDLRLKTSNPEQPLGVDLIRMSFDQAARLRPGQRVTVSCQRITGSGDEHWLQNCAIQPAVTIAAPTPPPPPPPPPPAEGNKG